MAESTPSGRTARAPSPSLLLLRGAPDECRAWLGAGLVDATFVASEQAWQLAAPRLSSDAAGGLAEDPTVLFFNRPVPRALRPAIGLFRSGQTALVVVTARRIGSRAKWLAWRPGIGAVEAGDLTAATARDIAHAAEVTDAAPIAALRDVLRDPLGDTSHFLEDVLTVLGLPGGDYLTGEKTLKAAPTSELVSANAESRAAYAKIAQDDEQWRDELQGDSDRGPEVSL